MRSPPFFGGGATAPLFWGAQQPPFFGGRNSPQWVRASSLTMFLNHTQRRTAVCRTPLYEWSARRRDLFLTTHNNHNRQTSMPPQGLEPTVSTGERPQTWRPLGPVCGSLVYINPHNAICLSVQCPTAGTWKCSILWKDLLLPLSNEHRMFRESWDSKRTTGISRNTESFNFG